MATEMARYINAFTNEIKTGVGLGHHGLTVESPGIDTPQLTSAFFQPKVPAGLTDQR